MFMKITEEQYRLIEDDLPRQRGNVRLPNLQVINAILYVVENGCKWRALPEHYGHWHTVYMRMNRWAKAGVLARLFKRLQEEQIITIKIEAVSLDSTSVKVHPDGTGALKKTVGSLSENPEVDGTPKFIWLPQMLEHQ
jgi:transposase